MKTNTTIQSIPAATGCQNTPTKRPEPPCTSAPTTWRQRFVLLAMGVGLCGGSKISHAQTWQTVNDSLNSTAYAITADSAGNIFVAGSTVDNANRPTAVVMKSSDGGQTWDNNPSTPDVDEPSDAITTTDGSFALFEALASRRVTTGVNTSEDQVVSTGRAGRVYGGPSNPLTGTLTSPWLVRRTRNAGTTWEMVDQFVHPTYNQLPGYARPRGVAIAQNGTIYVAGCAQQTITTKAKGQTTTTYVNHWLIRRGVPSANGSLQWSTFDFAFPVSSENDRMSNVFPSAVACVGSRVFVVGGGGNHWHVLQSSNGGLTWTVADNFRLATSGNSHAHAIAADGQGNLYVAGSGERVTTAGGGTTVLERLWIVRKGAPDGTNWSTVEQLANPLGSAAARGVTVDLNGDVHVTGTVQPASKNARWITRQRSATGVWSTTEDLSTEFPGSGEGRGIITDPFGDLFAAGGASDAAGVAHGWLVRRNLAR